MQAFDMQIQDIYACSKSKMTDYALVRGVRYGQSDASLTVEAAMVLPLVLLMMLAMLSWIQFFQKQEESMRGLNDQLRQLSGAAGVLAGEKAVLPEQVILMDSQTLRFPVGLFPVEKVFVRQAGLRMYTGRRYGVSDGVASEEKMVYLAETGSVYHMRESCTHLKLSVKPVVFEKVEELRNQQGAIYYACERCTEEKNNITDKQETVYITDEGNRYHRELGCSGLIRRIHTATLIEARESGRKACGRCAEGEMK